MEQRNPGIREGHYINRSRGRLHYPRSNLAGRCPISLGLGIDLGHSLAELINHPDVRHGIDTALQITTFLIVTGRAKSATKADG